MKRDAKLLELWQVRGDRDELVPLWIEEIDRAPVGIHRVGDDIDETLQELCRADFL